MKRLAGAVLAPTIILTGCSPVEALMPSAARDGELPAVIDLGVLPDVMPEAVVAQEPNVVRVERTERFNETTTPEGFNTYESKRQSLSGVRISETEFLTAGHGIFEPDGAPFNDIDKCDALEVNMASVKPVVFSWDAAGNQIELSGFSAWPNKFAGTYQRGVADVPDIALLTAPDIRRDALPYTTPVELYTGTPQPGTPMYLQNYEPTMDAQSRTPYEADLTAEQRAAGLSRPAMIGAVVLRVFENGEIHVITGSDSYGTPPDPFIRKGASGGPGLIDGKLAGLVVRTSEIMDVEEIEEELKVDFVGVAESTQLQVTAIQPVTPDLVGQLRQQISESPECVPR